MEIVPLWQQVSKVIEFMSDYFKNYLPWQLNILLSRLMVKLLTENMSNFLIVKSKSKSGSHVGKTE
jgi:hypothetical protein